MIIVENKVFAAFVDQIFDFDDGIKKSKYLSGLYIVYIDVSYKNIKDLKLYFCPDNSFIVKHKIPDFALWTQKQIDNSSLFNRIAEIDHLSFSFTDSVAINSAFTIPISISKDHVKIRQCLVV